MKQRILEYILHVSFFWAWYAVILTPFLFVVVGYSIHQWEMWFWSSLVYGFMIAYPTNKVTVKFEKWIRKKLKIHGKVEFVGVTFKVLKIQDGNVLLGRSDSHQEEVLHEGSTFGVRWIKQ